METVFLVWMLYDEMDIRELVDVFSTQDKAIDARDIKLIEVDDDDVVVDVYIEERLLK